MYTGTSSSPTSTLTLAAIIGGVVGGLAVILFLLVAVVVIVCLCSRSKICPSTAEQSLQDTVVYDYPLAPTLPPKQIPNPAYEAVNPVYTSVPTDEDQPGEPSTDTAAEPDASRVEVQQNDAYGRVW